jgi:hypothetical protein
MSNSISRSSPPFMTMVKGAGIGAILLMLLSLAIGPFVSILTALAVYAAFFVKFGKVSVADMMPKFGPRIDNVAFAEWRAREIAEIERRKAELDKSEADFAAFLLERKTIEDRKEFKRFMETKTSETIDV